MADQVDPVEARGATSPSDDVERPVFVSEEVWEVVHRAAEHNNGPVRDSVEKALLDEAIILEQVRIGRTWLVRDKRGRVGEIDFD